MASRSAQSEQYTGKLDGTWPDADIVVLPGFPDDSAPIEEALSKTNYPSTSTDVVKLLRAEGLSVDYAVERSERQLVSKNAAEHWLPIVIAVSEFGANTLTSALASIIAEQIVAIFGGGSKLHVHCGIKEADGSYRFIKASGPPEAVVEAVEAFGRR